VFARKVDNVGTVFLNNQLPVSDAIGSEVWKGKILVISVNCNQMFKENTFVVWVRLWCISFEDQWVSLNEMQVACPFG
jgi:hypothetical protein